MTVADNAPSDVGIEAVERFHNDAEFHALAYMAAVLALHDSGMDGEFSDEDRRLAQRAAAIAVLLTERKATTDAAKTQKEL